MDWYCNFLHVQPHFNSNTPCWLCNANDSTHPWTDFAGDASWRDSVHDPDVHREVSTLALFQIPGVSGQNLCIDALHTMCLGVSAHATGSALVDIIDQRTPGTTMTQRLRALWQRIRTHYSTMHTANRLNNLRLSMFVKTGKFAELSARGAEVRSLVPVLAAICEEDLKRTPSLLAAHRFEVLSHLSSVYDIFDRNGFQISEEDKVSLDNHVRGCAMHFKVLARNAIRLGKLRWQLTVKMHFFQHIAHQSRFLNPRFGWTYQYENFVQKLLRVSRACAKGTPPHKTGPSVMHKYRSVMAVRLNRPKNGAAEWSGMNQSSWVLGIFLNLISESFSTH